MEFGKKVKSVLDENMRLESDLSKITYQKHFSNFLEQEEGLYRSIIEMRAGFETKETFDESFAKDFVKEVQKQVDATPKARFKCHCILDYAFSFTTFFVPAFYQIDEQVCKYVVKACVAEWNRAFPDYPLRACPKKQTIKKRENCFITKVACETLGKTAACPALDAFRQYREQYLLHLPEGPGLVQQYRDIAPSIIKHIEKSGRAKQIYADMWERYLKLSYEKIQQGLWKEAEEILQKMMHEAQDHYFKVA